MAYWQKVKGTLIEEYPIVKKSKECSPRWIDGLIIKNGDFKQFGLDESKDETIFPFHICIIVISFITYFLKL